MALYSFCDTDQTPGNEGLPAEALCYNGVWIDEDIPIYRTLYVSGRESFSAEIAELSMESVDGSFFLRRRLMPRTITVGYQLSASTAQELMTACNRLNRLMSGIQVQVMFADEPDKYYIGTCKGIGAPEPGRLMAKGEMEIYCPDPCKYAAQETATAWSSEGTLAVEYEGSCPVRPKLCAQGFQTAATHVVFAGDNATVSAGDPDAAEGEEIFDTTSELVIDCAAGRIYKDGVDADALGSIDNGYEKMLLEPGANVITAAAYRHLLSAAASYRMQYRAAWL